MKLYGFPTIFSLLLLLAVSATAQQTIYSKYEDFDIRSGEFSVVGKAGNKLYVYRGSAEGYYMDAYNDKMERLATVILDFLPRKSFGTKFIVYEGKILVFYQTTEGGDIVQYGVVLDDRGRMKSKPVKIDEVKSQFLGGRSGLFNYAVSNDKEMIAIYGVGLKGNKLDARITWIDTGLHKQSVSRVSFEGDNNLAFGEGVITNDGKFYLPAYTPYGSRDYADRVWMLSLAMGGKSFTPAELPLNGLFASGTYMELSKSDNRIYLGGFYSDRKNGNFEGIIFSYYDIQSGDFKDFKHIPFSEKIRIATGERNMKRAFNDYGVRQLIVRNDGGFVMISESFYVSTRSNYSSGFGYYSWYYPTMSSNVTEYNYGDILAISCNGDGKPEWSEFIRKNQYSQQDGGQFSSYALINTGGAIGFLFNDFNLKRSAIKVVSLDADGQTNVITLPGVGAGAPDWLPKSGKQVSANEFVVPCLKRNEIGFAKIVF